MKKTYPTLYTKDSLNNIRIWFMEQDNDKYRTISGLKNGEHVYSEYTIAAAKNVGKKNETTAVEQATAEILAKYKKQEKTGYFANIDDVDKTQFIEPLLAKLYKDYASDLKLETGQWWLQCKFNGMRCIATINGLFTRKGERYISVPHVEESLKPFFAKYPNAVLDGELFNNDLRQQLNEISKLIRKTKHITSDDLERSKLLVKYYVYDGYGFDNDTGEDATYEDRKSWIDSNVINNYNHLVQVNSLILKNQKDLDNAYQMLVDDGQEGAILRNCRMGYEHKRSKNLLKVKPEDDSEGTIVEINEGTGNWSGTGKIITLNWENKTFDATFKGTYEQGVEFWKNRKNWIGKKVTFLYNGLTGLGTPNYARVDINNCIKGDH